MKNLLVFIGLSLSFMLSAQSELREINNLNRDMQAANRGQVDPNIEGTPYWNETFQKGEIVLKDNGIYKNVLLRYDAFNGVIETQQNEQVFRFTNASSLAYAVIDSDTLYYLSYKRLKKEIEGYFYCVVNGHLSLYVHHSKNFKRAQEPIGFQDAIPASYVNNADKYFLQLADDELIEIASKKDISAFFNDKSIDTYIKKHKVNPRKEETLIALVNYYNSSKK